jgi:hypothetical protein
MQTFLPYRDFNESAKVIDPIRRWKQVVEARQLVAVLTGNTNHWKNPNAWREHPAAVMWQGHVNALKYYCNCFHLQVIRSKSHLVTAFNFYDLSNVKITYPWWLGMESFHRSHRSNLLRKDSVFYGQYGWKEPHDLPYVWPSPVNPLFS